MEAMAVETAADDDGRLEIEVVVLEVMEDDAGIEDTVAAAEEAGTIEDSALDT